MTVKVGFIFVRAKNYISQLWQPFSFLFVQKKNTFCNCDNHLTSEFLSQSNWHCSQWDGPIIWGWAFEKYDSIQARNRWRWNCWQWGNANMHLRAIWGNLNWNLSSWKPKLHLNFPQTCSHKCINACSNHLWINMTRKDFHTKLISLQSLKVFSQRKDIKRVF